MTFEEAGEFVVKFGRRFRGQKVKDIAQSNPGLSWLVWCTGEEVRINNETKALFRTYIDHPSVREKAKIAVEEESRRWHERKERKKKYHDTSKEDIPF